MCRNETPGITLIAAESHKLLTGDKNKNSVCTVPPWRLRTYVWWQNKNSSTTQNTVAVKTVSCRDDVQEECESSAAHCVISEENLAFI